VRQLATENYDKISDSGIVVIGRKNEMYYVCSGNLVENHDIHKLVQRIEGLVSLDKNELKKLYKEEMKNEVLPGSFGAGLGLIDMARKASMPIDYTIEKLDDEFSFFTIKVLV
jgi:hypothetical protein